MPVLFRFTAIRVNSAQINNALLVAELDAFTQAHIARIITEVAPYPPPPPRPPNRYVRTNRLITYWRARRKGLASWEAYNPVQDPRGRYYAGYVHGPAGQAWFHAAHGWKNVRDYLHRTEFAAGAQAIIAKGIRL